MKGPKAILASCIATALNQFFEVDKDRIESHLLGDAKIVLKDVKLRPRQTNLPNSSCHTSAHVERAFFSWTWSASGMWVKDATLTIEGSRVVVELGEKEAEDIAPKKKEKTLVENMEEAAQPHAASPEVITSQGGIRGYIKTLVQQIIDSVKLRVEDYQLTIQLPSQKCTYQEIEWETSEKITIQGEAFELISLGRLDPTDMSAKSQLKSQLNLQNFLMRIRVNDEIVDLVEQFNYRASVTRTCGQRFGRLTENLQFQGHGADLKMHMGRRQMKTLSSLRVLLMAPPGKEAIKPLEPTQPTPEEAVARVKQIKREGSLPPTEQEDSKAVPPDNTSSQRTKAEPQPTHPTQPTTQDMTVAPGNTPSHFGFDIGLLQITLDEKKFTVTNAKLAYRADGTVMTLEADGFGLQGHNDLRVKVSGGVQANLLAPVTITIGTIEQVTMPYMAKLVQPVKNTKIVKEGQAYLIEFVDTVEIEMLKGKIQTKEDDAALVAAEMLQDESPENQQRKHQPKYRANIVPFPLSISINHLVRTKEADDNRTQLFQVHANADPTPQGTEFALEFGKVQNYLIRMQDALIAGKLDQPGQINMFRFSAKEIQVTAGYNAGEWAAAFEPKGTAEELETKYKKLWKQSSNVSTKDSQRQSQNDSVAMKLPNCYFGPLKTTIAVKGKGTGFEVKDTKVTVKAFQGKEGTTTNDLVRYYSQSIMKHAHDFIPNAELMGLNVVDSTMGAFGNYVGMAALGPLGGIATLGAVDALKATISKGKHSRNRDDGDQTKVTDVVLGAIDFVQETGTEFENRPITLIQNTAGKTGDYMYENKARLGAAGVGGAGMVIGGVVGGPAGAIVLGVAAQAITGKIIEKVEESNEKQKQRLNG